jgi:hypothetical protein
MIHTATKFFWILVILSSLAQAEAPLLDPVQTAQEHGFKPSPGPHLNDPYAPFIRMVRKNGATPIESRGCAEIVFRTHVGKLNTTQKSKRTGRDIYANPYVYSSFEMKLASGHKEYIEAGWGYREGDPAQGTQSQFVPYIRRAPDDQKVDDTLPPPGWTMKRGIRGGILKDLPGYWEANTDHPTQLLAPTGEFCFHFRFDSNTNRYFYDYLIKNPVSGTTPYRGSIAMPSVRKLVVADPLKSKIESFQTRLLTSIAITDDAYDPADPIYRNIGLGVRWKAQVFDPSRRFPAWEQFYSRDFFITNADSQARALYFEIHPALPGDLEF